MKIILASSSPRRQQILNELNIDFEIIKPQVTELTLKSARETVIHNAKIKAQKIAQKYPYALIIAADTVVNLDDKILEKPFDLAQAKMMLTSLSNRWHEVYTAVSLISPNYQHSWLSQAQVHFYKLSTQIIEQYIELINPFDKAGSYNIAEQKIKVVKEIKGCQSTIMGLPIEQLKEQLRYLKIIR